MLCFCSISPDCVNVPWSVFIGFVFAVSINIVCFRIPISLFMLQVNGRWTRLLLPLLPCCWAGALWAHSSWHATLAGFVHSLHSGPNPLPPAATAACHGCFDSQDSEFPISELSGHWKCLWVWIRLKYCFTLSCFIEKLALELESFVLCQVSHLAW